MATNPFMGKRSDIFPRLLALSADQLLLTLEVEVFHHLWRTREEQLACRTLHLGLILQGLVGYLLRFLSGPRIWQAHPMSKSSKEK